MQLALLLARRERVERLQLAMEEEKRQQRAKQRMRLKKEEVRTMGPQPVVRRKREKPPMERALMEIREYNQPTLVPPFTPMKASLPRLILRIWKRLR